MVADRSPGIARPVRYGPHCFVSGHGRPFRAAYAARFHLGWDPESAMGHYFSVTRHNPVMNQDVSPPPVSADADTPGSSPSHQARTASGPLQGLRPMQAQHALAVAPNPASGADAGLAIAGRDLLPEMWTEIAHRSDPVARQGLRAASKTLKAAAEVGIRQLTITTPEGLAAVKRPGNYPNLTERTLVGDFWSDDLSGLPPHAARAGSEPM